MPWQVLIIRLLVPMPTEHEAEFSKFCLRLLCSKVESASLLTVDFVFRRIFQMANARQEGARCPGEGRDLRFDGSTPP